jgi:hypothetical protein
MLKYCDIFAQIIVDGTAMEQLGKHVPMATDTYATIQELLEMVFPTWSVQRGLRRTREARIVQMEGSLCSKWISAWKQRNSHC